MPFDQVTASPAKSIRPATAGLQPAKPSKDKSNTPFLEAMKQARLRNPNLGLDRS
jgi:hypothetical protein